MKVTHTMKVGDLRFILSDIYILSTGIESHEAHLMTRRVISNPFYYETLYMVSISSMPFL